MAQKKAHEVEGYVRDLKPDSAPILCLVYGGDGGGIYEIITRLRHLWLGATPEPTQNIALTIAANDPHALTQEAASMGLFGSQDAKPAHKFIYASGALEEATEFYLQSFDDGALNPDCLVVLEAGTLTPAAPLRKLVEKHGRAMALPCFPLLPKDVVSFARGWLKQEGFSIEAAAQALLGEKLAGDRGIMQRGLERLALYKGHDKAGDKSALIDVQDIDTLFGEPEQNHVSDLIDAVALGATDKMDALILRLSAAGRPPQTCLAQMRQHFQNLHLAVGARANGANLASAMGAFRPPVHFLRRQQVERQINLWSLSKIERALSLLYEAEIESRSSLPASLIASAVARHFLRLSTAAARK